MKIVHTDNLVTNTSVHHCSGYRARELQLDQDDIRELATMNPKTLYATIAQLSARVHRPDPPESMFAAWYGESFEYCVQAIKQAMRNGLEVRELMPIVASYAINGHRLSNVPPHMRTEFLRMMEIKYGVKVGDF